MTEEATEMPRCFSISIQSEVAWREALRAFTEPAIWIAPENSSSFSVSVVLPASGWLMMAKVRRRRTSLWMRLGWSADMGGSEKNEKPAVRTERLGGCGRWGALSRGGQGAQQRRHALRGACERRLGIAGVTEQ